MLIIYKCVVALDLIHFQQSFSEITYCTFKMISCLICVQFEQQQVLI